MLETRAFKFLWIEIIVITAVSGFIGSIWLALLPGWSMVVNYNLGYVGCALSLAPLPFLMILLSIPLLKIKLLKIDISTLSILYTTGISSAFFINEYFPWYLPGTMLTSRYLNPQGSLTYIPSFAAPEKEVALQILNGHVPIPWVSWLPTIIFQWIFQVVFVLFMISITTIMRKQWIDIEKVPFPQTLVAYEFVKKVASKEGGLFKRLGKSFIIGLLVGVVVQVPIFMTTIFPWFPDIYSWKVNTCAFGATWITADSPLAAIGGLTTLNKWPPFAAVFYLAPINVLGSFLLWFFIYCVLTQIAYAQGSYTGLLAKAGCGRNWCGSDLPGAGPPFKWTAVSNIGGPIGLTLFYLILNRRYVANTIKAAIGKMTPEERENFEKDEPISYKLGYTILIVSIISIAFVLMALGVSLIVVLVTIVTSFVMLFAGTRVFGLLGYNAIDYGGYGLAYVWLIWPTWPENATREWFYFRIMQTMTTDGFGYGFSGTLSTSFSAYKMGTLTETSNKVTFKVIMLASVVAPLAALVGMIWSCYAFGASTIPEYSDMGKDLVGGVIATRAQDWPAVPPWILNAVAGVILVGALSFLHARFVWFPLEPVGFLMATTGHTLLEGVWTTALVAFIAKEFTLRVGGSKAYETYGTSFASGAIVGTVVAILIGGLIGIIRFFIPF